MKNTAVIIVPGIGGSRLSVDGKPFWPPPIYSLPAFLLEFPKLKVPTRHQVDAPEIVDEIIWVGPTWRQSVYGRLVRFLEEVGGFRKGTDLFECPYDWRLSITSAALILARKVKEVKDTGLGIVLICHSMGGLVAQYSMKHHLNPGDVMSLVQLGTPNLGAPETFDRYINGWYFGPKQLIRAIQSRLSPLRTLYDRCVRQTVETFPSIYELLPHPGQPCILDSFGRPVDIYADTGWLSATSDQTLLASATKLYRDARQASSNPAVNISGDWQVTTLFMRQRRRQAGQWSSLKTVKGREGDGTVPFCSASPPDSYPQPYGAQHGDLYVHTDIQYFLLRYLERLDKGGAPGAAAPPGVAPPPPPDFVPPGPWLQLTTDQQVYAVGEPIALRARPYDEFGTPISVDMWVGVSASGAGKDWSGEMKRAGPYVYESELPAATEEGDVVITATGEGPIPRATGVTSIGVVSREADAFIRQELPGALRNLRLL